MGAWHVFVARLCRLLYYSRVTLLGRERLPGSGPALYVALHRNGAVDGCVYAKVTPGATFMISTQLRRSLLGRVFFAGVEVVRDRDKGDRTRNERAMLECLELLRGGGQLIVMPEGTSSLGPRHLPFHRGAARVAEAALAAGVPLRIVPLGIHYERAWAFRSRVEVVIGEPVDAALQGNTARAPRVARLHERIARALEAVGVQFASAGAQDQCEQLAYVSTLGTGRHYFDSLKQLECGIPPAVLMAAARLERQIGSRHLLRHQGVPLCPMGPLVTYALLLVMLTPVVAVAAVLNAPPLAAGAWAGRYFPDERNVVALWRLLVGLPILAIWAAAIVGTGAATGAWWVVAGYLGVTLGGLIAWYRYKKLAVATLNGLRFPSLRGPLLAFRETVIRELDGAGG